MPDYGDPALVKKLIRASEGHDPGADVNDRITILNSAISRRFEKECGMTWGAAAVDTNEVHWLGPYDTLVLNRPARAITSITYGGTLTGTTMTGGTTVLASSLYYPIVDEDGLIRAVRARNATVWSWSWTYSSTPDAYERIPVVVTGDFVTTDNDNAVPDDITYAVSRCIAETLKDEKASAFGAIGPDGTVAPLRNVFEIPIVRKTLNDYKRTRVMVV